MKLQNSNPNGFNQYKKSKKKQINQPPIIDKEMIQAAYREMWKAKCIHLSKADRYNYLKNKFFGIDKIKEEVEKEIAHKT